MADVDVKWVRGRVFEASDEAGHTVLTGSDPGVLKATALLLAALAGCAGVDIVGILEKKRQKVTGVEAHVTKHSEPEPPWYICQIDIEWVVRGHKLSDKAVHDAVHLAETKYCSVAASLKSEIITSIRVVEDATGDQNG
jgi:putative redox protein